ncbi:MAG: hypothetical protein JO203_01540 [Gammaproteobacteria bacterium]|nr:hypothetical protein [Gammaproteobacteria bacterium]
MISNLSFTPTSAAEGSGTVTVNGTLSFTDSGGDLASFQITVLDSTGKQVSSSSAPIQGQSGKTSGTLAGVLQVGADTPGIFTVQVVVVDSGGSKSNTLSGNFQVVPVSSHAAVVTATGPGPQSLLDINGTLYWSESGEDAIKSAPSAGGTAVAVATKMVNPVSMVFYGSDLIWLDDRPAPPAGCGVGTTNRVLKRMTASGTITVISNGPACRGGATDIVLVGGSVYWVSSTESTDTWYINQVPLSGGPGSTIRTTPTPIVALAGTGNTLYWMESFFPTNAAIYSLSPPAQTVSTVASGFPADTSTFAVDSAAVYYATPNFPYNPPLITEQLWAQPLGGGAAKELSASIATPLRMLSTANLSGNSLVWIDSAAVNSIPTAGGAITKLAGITGTPIDLLFDGANVEWSELTNVGLHGESGAIRSVPLGGGTVTVLHQGGDAPRQLQRDNQARINWTEGGPVGETEGFGRIARDGLTGSEEPVVGGVSGNPAMLAAAPGMLLIADQWRVKSIALPPAPGLPTGMAATLVAPAGGSIGGLTSDGTSVYWDDINWQVSKAPLAGGAVTVLVAHEATGNSGPGGPIRVAPNGNLYWVAGTATPVNLLSAPTAAPSAAVTGIAMGIAAVTDLAVDSTSVYLSNSPEFAISKLPLGGGSSTVLVSTGGILGATARGQLLLDGPTLYWMENDGIFKVPAAGGVPTAVIDFDSGTPTSFALDSSSVYYTDSQLQDIRSAPK